MLKWFKWVICCVGFLFAVPALSAPIRIVAAENFYGSVAKAIGGPYVQVKSIMSQPDQDPHLFSATPSIAKSLAQADWVVFNGLGYDDWMINLLKVNPSSQRQVLCVGELLNKKNGDNPHIWYDPATMPRFAKAVQVYLSERDPRHAQRYALNYQRFMRRFDRLLQLIQQLKPHTQGVQVIATEPVFGYMAQALGFTMENMPFQLSMMNDVDPSPRQVLDFQNALVNKRVRILFFNKQVSSPLVQQLLQLAQAHGIPVVGVTETQPLHTYYVKWMTKQLLQLKQALNERSHV